MQIVLKSLAILVIASLIQFGSLALNFYVFLLSPLATFAISTKLITKSDIGSTSRRIGWLGVLNFLPFASNAAFLYFLFQK